MQQTTGGIHVHIDRANSAGILKQLILRREQMGAIPVKQIEHLLLEECMELVIGHKTFLKD